MNEQAWKEQAARALILDADCDPDVFKGMHGDYGHFADTAAALYPLVQQAIAAERERCAKVAAGPYSSTSRYHEDSPFYGSDLTPDRSEFGRGVQRGREQAATAIRSLKEADNGAGNECICPKCGLRHGGKVDSGAVF